MTYAPAWGREVAWTLPRALYDRLARAHGDYMAKFPSEQAFALFLLDAALTHLEHEEQKKVRRESLVQVVPSAALP